MEGILTDDQRRCLAEDLLVMVHDVRLALHDDPASVPPRTVEAAAQVASTLLFEDGRRSGDAVGGRAAANATDRLTGC